MIPAMQPRADGKIHVTVDVESVAVPFEEHIANITKAAIGLSEVCIDAENRWDSPSIVVTGWRLPNAEELASMAAADKINERNARETLRLLRRNYPGLFDGQGRPKEDTADADDAIPF